MKSLTSSDRLQLRHAHPAVHPHVTYNERGKKHKTKMPHHMYNIKLGYNVVYQTQIENAIPSSAINNDTEIFMDLEKDSIEQLNGDLWLVLDITASGDVSCNPAPYLFERTRLIRLSDHELTKYYPLNSLMWLFHVYDKWERQQYWDLVGFKEVDQDGQTKIVPNLEFKNGDTRSIWIPIPVGALFASSSLDMTHLKKKLRWELQIKNADFIRSGSASDLSIDNIYIYSKHKEEASQDKRHRMKDKMSHNFKYNTIDYERIIFNDKTLTAGNRTNFLMDDYVHKSAGLMFVIYNSTSPSASELLSFVEVGEDAKYNHESNAGIDIYGKGKDINKDLIYQIYSNNMHDKGLRGVYFLPYADIREALVGTVNGFYEFNSRSDRLIIEFPQASTAHRIDVSVGGNTADGGFYYYSVNGEVTAPLAFGATPATIKTALENLKNLSDREITVTVSGDMTADSTITFNGGAGRVENDLTNFKIISNLTDGGVAFAPTLSTGVQGKTGWTTSANYTVEVYSYKYRELEIDHKGYIKATNL